MKGILTAQSINLEQLRHITNQKNIVAGTEDYAAGRVTIAQVEAQVATLTVDDHRSGKPYSVTIRSGADGTIGLTCTCREGYPWVACRHRYAAALALRDHLTANPPKVWRYLMEHAKPAAPRRSSTNNALILFSLIERNPSAWIIQPYTLNIRHLDGVDLTDRAAVADKIVELNMAREAKPLRSRVQHSAYPYASEDDITATNLALGNPYAAYGYASSRDSGAFYQAVLPYLSRCLSFIGEEGDPFQARLDVRSEPAAIQAELRQSRKGITIVGQILVGGDTIPIQPNATSVLAQDPMWLLVDTTLVRFQTPPSGLAATLLEEPSILVPSDDAEEFYDRYLPTVAAQLPVSGKMLDWREQAEKPQPRLYLSDQDGQLQGELRLGYGPYEVSYERLTPSHTVQRVPGSTQFTRIRRDAGAEHEAASLLGSSAGFKKSTEANIFPLRANMNPIDFLLHQVPKLVEKGFTIFGENELVSARVNRNKPSISFNVTSGIDWFDVKAVVNFGDLTVSLKDIRQAVRKRERYIKLADGSIGEIPEEWLARYRHLFAHADSTDGETLRVGQNSLTLIDQLLGEADGAQADEAFQQRRDKLRNFQSIAPHTLPPGFIGQLRPYQKFGYDWLHFLQEYHFGGCLADDMGVGKTIQTLAFLESIYHDDNSAPASLIVMPRSLLFNWQREAEKFTPGLDVYVQADQGRIADPAQFGEHNLVLTTYGTMLRDIELLSQYEFHHIILDESQMIKNPLAETSKAARLLRGRHRLALTGTPIENTTMELWSQFAFLNPGLLGSLDYFRQEFVNPIERQQRGETSDFLRKMVFPFILRRTKDQVATDLPPRTERVIVCDMEPAQLKVYNKQRDIYRAKLLGLIDNEGMDDARMQILEGLLRLRQISNHPRLVDAKYKGGSGKFELLFETLDTLRAEGHRALIFSQFVQMLALVRQELDAKGVPYAYLDGQTRDRQEQVDRFQGDGALPFFLISLKAGGVGLNLTAADYVIHVDPWWNPAVEQQATDRTHRIGQDKPVFVYKMVARGTVEEKILQLQERKRELVAQIIGDEGGVFKSLTREDVEVLFS
ncbi:serine/threonine protein kinase [Chloroflexia bacterium SDU3-3]|nr:serine/threonine protein kinase [Chloroflexia bacterium SDU3-3]